jgi:DNA/RNA-binding domain of Phe-tRNA-synthetase-like protein
VSNPEEHQGLETKKGELETRLRARYGAMDRSTLAALAPLSAYAEYYRRFGKTYHVLSQLESVAVKGRALPRVAALVEAMFMAELEDQMLTAGHDLESLGLPVTAGTARGTERYVLLRGEEKTAVADDLLMSDRTGVISTVLHGPDRRTAITPVTRSALFAVYAPPGVGRDSLRGHLERILGYVRVISPDAEVASIEVL